MTVYRIVRAHLTERLASPGRVNRRPSGQNLRHVVPGKTVQTTIFYAETDAVGRPDNVWIEIELGEGYKVFLEVRLFSPTGFRFY